VSGSRMRGNHEILNEMQSQQQAERKLNNSLHLELIAVSWLLNNHSSSDKFLMSHPVVVASYSPIPNTLSLCDICKIISILKRSGSEI